MDKPQSKEEGDRRDEYEGTDSCHPAVGEALSAWRERQPEDMLY
jgi:hypothetical protein